jgi:uncharacterized protein
MQRNFNRRDLLKNSGLAAAGLALSPFLSSALRAESTPGERKKVLFFTKSSGFQHSSITRNADQPEKLAWAEQILTDLGAKHGFDVTCTKDGKVFLGDLKQYAIIAFYTTGDLTKDSENPWNSKAAGNVKGKTADKRPEPGMTDAGKEAFLDAIKNGTGFIGFHSATDTFHSANHHKGKTEMLRDVNEKGEDEFDPYIQMIGGEFIIHGKQQNATLKTIDPKFPGAEAFNDKKFVEEWYSLKNFANDLHVILAQDCTGMEGPMYARGTYPETWARMHGQGRVFYTSMGHRENVWEMPEFQNLVAGALNWTSKKIKVDVTPNIQQATPDANVKAS